MSTPDLNKVRDLVEQMRVELGPKDQGGQGGTGTPGTGTPGMGITTVKAGQSIQTAIDGAALGSTVMIEPGTYKEKLVIGKRINLRLTQPRPPGLRSPGWLPMILMSPGEGIHLTPESVGTTISGLGVMSEDPDLALINDEGKQTVLDSVLGLGDQLNGQHHGIIAHGQGCRYLDCFINQCGRVGQDAQALIGWDGTRDLEVIGGYYGGAGECIMFGGADSTSPDRIPTNITLTGVELGKDPAWYAMGWQIKCALELKAVIGFMGTGIKGRYAGVAEGQAAYQVVITPRNQKGKAPWTQVKDVLIEKSVFTIGGGGVNILAQDNNFPTQITSNITLRDVAFLELDPLGFTSTVKYKGAGRGINFDGPSQAVTLERVTVQGINMGSNVYIKGKPVELIIKDLKMGPARYPWKIDAGGQGIPAVQAWLPDAVIEVTAGDMGSRV